LGPLVLFAAVALFTLPPSPTAAAPESCGNNVFDVPDKGEVFDFTAACEAHDACFATHAGGTEPQRKACDDAFFAAMMTSCNDMWAGRFDLSALGCRLVAGLYYVGVRLGGWLFF
jgi:hypothetical protein